MGDTWPQARARSPRRRRAGGRGLSDPWSRAPRRRGRGEKGDGSKEGCVRAWGRRKRSKGGRELRLVERGGCASGQSNNCTSLAPHPDLLSSSSQSRPALPRPPPLEAPPLLSEAPGAPTWDEVGAPRLLASSWFRWLSLSPFQPVRYFYGGGFLVSSRLSSR